MSLHNQNQCSCGDAQAAFHVFGREPGFGAISWQQRFYIFHLMKGQEGRKSRDGYHTDASSPTAAMQQNYP